MYYRYIFVTLVNDSWFYLSTVFVFLYLRSFTLQGKHQRRAGSGGKDSGGGHVKTYLHAVIEEQAFLPSVPFFFQRWPQGSCGQSSSRMMLLTLFRFLSYLMNPTLTLCVNGVYSDVSVLRYRERVSFRSNSCLCCTCSPSDVMSLYAMSHVNYANDTSFISQLCLWRTDTDTGMHRWCKVLLL